MLYCKRYKRSRIKEQWKVEENWRHNEGLWWLDLTDNIVLVLEGESDFEKTLTEMQVIKKKYNMNMNTNKINILVHTKNSTIRINFVSTTNL